MSFDENFSEGTPSGAGARFFTAKPHLGAYAILIEFKRFEKDVPLYKPKEQVYTDKNTGQKSVRTITHEDIAYADLTVFASEEHIEAGKPSVELQNQKINQRLLAADLANEKPGALLVKKLVQLPTNALVWRPVEGDVIKKVGRYYDEREAALKATLDEAGEDLPEWARA